MRSANFRISTITTSASSTTIILHKLPLQQSKCLPVKMNQMNRPITTTKSNLCLTVRTKNQLLLMKKTAKKQLKSQKVMTNQKMRLMIISGMYHQYRRENHKQIHKTTMDLCHRRRSLSLSTAHSYLQTHSLQKTASNTTHQPNFTANPLPANAQVVLRAPPTNSASPPTTTTTCL